MSIVAYWFIILAAYRKEEKHLVRDLYSKVMWESLREQLKIKRTASKYFQVPNAGRNSAAPLTATIVESESEAEGQLMYHPGIDYVLLPTEGCLNVFISSSSFTNSLNALNDYVDYFFGIRSISSNPFNLVMKLALVSGRASEILVLYKMLRLVVPFDLASHVPTLKIITSAIETFSNRFAKDDISAEAQQMNQAVEELHRAQQELIVAGVREDAPRMVRGRGHKARVALNHNHHDSSLQEYHL